MTEAIRRILPTPERPRVGPFALLDHFGPARLPKGQGVDVRPHPHIHLATVTHAFEGEIVHRDHLGTTATIRPGDVGWMTAGRGIVHSERSSDESRAADATLHGLQLWVALPVGAEDAEPGYAHHPAATIPEREADGMTLRVLAGAIGDLRAPVRIPSPLVLAVIRLAEGATWKTPPDLAEGAVYVVSGAIRIAGADHGAGRLVMAPPGGCRIEAVGPTHVVLLGGEPLAGPRHLWWNFLSSDPARIREAARDWQAGRFPAVPGDDERIPLPEDLPLPAV